MPWVEDPSWGNIFKGFADSMASAPEEALKTKLMAEQILTARQKRAQDQQLWDMGTKTGSDFEKAVPQASVPPTDYTAPGPMIGDPNNPDDTKGIPTVDLQYTDPTKLAAAESRRNLTIAANKQLLMTHPEQAIPQLGYGSVAAAGVPKTADERAQMEFYTTGKFPDRSVDESKLPVKPYIVLGPDGKTVEQGVTKDFKTNLTTGRPISPGAMPQLASPTSPDRPSDFSDKGKMTTEFAALSERVNRGESLSIPDIERANVLREQLHPQSAGFQTIGGQQRYVASRPVPVPDYANRLSDLVDAYRSQAHLQPPPAPAGAGATPAVPPAATAPAVPGAGGANAPQIGPLIQGNPQELRNEIQSKSQAFSDYAVAIPSYNTMIKAAQGDERTGLPTNASDLNIIYAIAKLFDPGSVVREGELKLAAGAAPIAQVLQSNWSRLITGEGSLTPETRAQLIGEGMKRMEEYKNSKDLAVNFYSDLAKRQNVDPKDVIPPLPEMRPYSKQAIENPTLPGGAQPTTPPAARAQPAPSPVIDQADKLVGGR